MAPALHLSALHLPALHLPALHLSVLLRRLGWGRGGPSGPRGALPPGPPADPAARARVVATARRLAPDARQQDGTTCGSAVLTLLAALGDPVLERWLVTGRLAGTVLPPELTGAPPDALERLADAPAAARFGALHRVLQRRTNAGALLGLPWPGALGTPPWGAARVARYPGVRWTHRPLDGSDRVALRCELDGVRAWLAAGVPVPLYSGGDARQGLAAAVPRHVVLAVGTDGDGLDVVEPGRGAVVRVALTDLLAGGQPLPALGGWRHLTWVVAPAAAGSRAT